MEKFSFFNDVNDDRVYYAEDWARHLKKYFTNGIFNNELNVVANDDMTITIKEGDANIEGYRYTNTGDLVKTIEMADGTLNRIDNVVLRLDLTNRLISAQIIKGTFADKPVAPELVRTSTIYDLRLAKISIPAGTTTITQDLITDTRFITSDCGNVISTVQTPDTENLFIQMQTLFEKQINELNNNFETWFDSMKNQLSSDAAGNLQNQINDLNSNKADNVTYDPNSKNLQLTSNGKNVGDSVHIPTGITDDVSGEENLKIVNNKGVVKFSLDGKTSQKSYTGKNLIDYSNSTLRMSTNPLNGVSVSVDDDGIITLNGTSTDSVSFCISKMMTDLLKSNKKYSFFAENLNGFQSNQFSLILYGHDGSKAFNLSQIISTMSGKNVRNITSNQDYNTAYFWFYCNKGITFNNLKIRLMLVEGDYTIDTIGEYEPYVGGQSSPNPDYSQKIENVRGVENLLKNTNVKSGDGNYWINYSTFDEETGTLTRSTTATTEAYINHNINNLKSNTTYTLFLEAKSNGYVSTMDLYCFNKNTEGIKSKTKIELSTEFQKFKFTFTTDKNVDYSNNSMIRIDNNGSTTDGTEAILTIKNVMLVECSYVDDYVPYGSNYLQLKNTTDNESKIINIDLKGNELCSNKEQTLKDELIIENGRAKIIKKYDEVILDGTEDFIKQTTSTSNYVYDLEVSNLIKATTSSEVLNVMCSHLKSQSLDNAWTGKTGICITNTSKLRFCYVFDNTDTLEKWKAFLKSQYDSGNPVKVQYQLAEPKIIDLGEVDLELLEGNSTLNVEEELKPTISVKYYTDENVVALKNEVVKKQNKVLSGTTVPNQSLGEDGDIYFQYGS